MGSIILKKTHTAFYLSKELLKAKKTYTLNKLFRSQGFFLGLLFLGFLNTVFAQNEKSKDSLWIKEGKIGVLANQANFGEWLGGGTNSFNGIVNFDYKLTRKRNEWDWTTIFDASLGFTKTESSDFFKKTVDHLEINSVFARVGENPWGFSSSVNIKSQWIEGFSFSEASSGEEISTKITDFLSPLYVRFGFGFTYKKSKSFSLQVEPLTGRLIYVSDQFTKDLALGETYFGVKPNRQTRWEAGLSLSAQGEWPLLPNVILRNKFNLISNYLEEFKNFDFDYTMTIDMKINNYLSTQLEIQLVYDDNAIAKMQSRQVFGVSVGFSF